jgi:hypothetical protein
MFNDVSSQRQELSALVFREPVKRFPLASIFVWDTRILEVKQEVSRSD